MPKTLELTVELHVQKVTCPGVWLCQDGGVSLMLYALGTTFETCMVPPTFPLIFDEKQYFQKRYHDTCALSNISCMLKDETLYCELVQWAQCGVSCQSKILAQYLGSLSDIIFPPPMCSCDGVDLLMRRSKHYPGILAPKIEIMTKVRIDEVWNNKIPAQPFTATSNPRPCRCSHDSDFRQKAVCHSREYHRHKCGTDQLKSSRSRSRSGGASSYCSLKDKASDKFRSIPCPCDTYKSAPHSPRMRRTCHRDYQAYYVEMPNGDQIWNNVTKNGFQNDDMDSESETSESSKEQEQYPTHIENKKPLLESRYVDDEVPDECIDERIHTRTYDHSVTEPCLCRICRRYHEIFHSDGS